MSQSTFVSNQSETSPPFFYHRLGRRYFCTSDHRSIIVPYESEEELETFFTQLDEQTRSEYLAAIEREGATSGVCHMRPDNGAL
ncbi:MAG: hypothetical protein KIH65_000285 [Candidatus Uhrbacteria bacterium]|nr:hypothetical protein [Candidatus Uhrbacteria bacterium]